MAGLIQIINPSPDTYDFIFADLLASKATLLMLDLRSRRILSHRSGAVIEQGSLYGLSYIEPATSTASNCQVPPDLLRNLDAAKLNEQARYIEVVVATAAVTTAKASLAACISPIGPISCPASIAAIAGALGTLALKVMDARVAQLAREAAELVIEE